MSLDFIQKYLYGKVLDCIVHHSIIVRGASRKGVKSTKMSTKYWGMLAGSLITAWFKYIYFCHYNFFKILAHLGESPGVCHADMSVPGAVSHQQWVVTEEPRIPGVNKGLKNKSRKLAQLVCIGLDTEHGRTSPNVQICF